MSNRYLPYIREPYVKSRNDLIKRINNVEIPLRSGRIKFKPKFVEFPEEYREFVYDNPNRGTFVNVPDLIVNREGEVYDESYKPFRNLSDLVIGPIERDNNPGSLIFDIHQKLIPASESLESLPEMENYEVEGLTSINSTEFQNAIQNTLISSIHVPVIDYTRVCREKEPQIITADVDKGLIQDLEVYMMDIDDSVVIEITKEELKDGTIAYVMKHTPNHLAHFAGRVLDACLHPSSSLAYFIPPNQRDSKEYNLVPHAIKSLRKDKEILTFTIGPGDIKIIPDNLQTD